MAARQHHLHVCGSMCLQTPLHAITFVVLSVVCMPLTCFASQRFPDWHTADIFSFICSPAVPCCIHRAAQAEQEKRQRQQQQGDGSTDEADAGNATTAEDAGAIIVYHETILKLKRILLNYM